MQISTVTPLELRKFGLMMAFVLMIIFGLALPLALGKSLPVLLWGIGSLFLVLAVIKPSLLKLVYVAWMKFGHVLGWINTRIILGVIFFVMITPIGLIMRLFGNDPMNKCYNAKLSTYRKNVKSPPINHMEKPF